MEEWIKNGKSPNNPFAELAKKLNNRYSGKAIGE
jgi:hypothetical protein